MGKRNRGLRANWDEEMMQEALNLIKEGKSQRYVEQHCGIPRRTLRAHIKSGSSKRKLGRQPVLSTELEGELESKIIRFAERGFPLTPKTIRRCVFQFVTKKTFQILLMLPRNWLDGSGTGLFSSEIKQFLFVVLST